jgi:hypothetical protein
MSCARKKIRKINSTFLCNELFLLVSNFPLGSNSSSNDNRDGHKILYELEKKTQEFISYRIGASHSKEFS